VGLVFQYPEYQLFEETAFRDIAFGPKNMGLSEAEIRQRVLRAASFVGLTEQLLEKSPFDLSGGQKRRVAIAGVIAMEPEVLILDEPTRGIDVGTKTEIQKMAIALAKQRGMSVVFISSEMDEMVRTCTKLIVMRDRRKVAELTGDDISSDGVMKAIAGGAA
jgi:energy-coupling factor transporter ATP-binding protein EcfA2